MTDKGSMLLAAFIVFFVFFVLMALSHFAGN